MASNSREEVLSCALDLVRAGEVVSFDSVARRSGLSKPGLMYHFRTKKAMMLALVDHVAAGWLEEMATRLSSALPASTSPHPMNAP